MSKAFQKKIDPQWVWQKKKNIQGRTQTWQTLPWPSMFCVKRTVGHSSMHRNNYTPKAFKQIQQKNAAQTEICIFGETLNCLSASICFKSQHVCRFNIPWIQHSAHVCHLFKDLVGHCVSVEDYSEFLYTFLYLCWNGLIHINYLVLRCSFLEYVPVCALKAFR